tara:strand:+ start:624 stop:1028 length:405 start_codon:yes stop_codon:yes gene_type:complete
MINTQNDNSTTNEETPHRLLNGMSPCQCRNGIVDDVGGTWTIDVNTIWCMLDRDEWLADTVADTIQDIDEVLTARQFINILFERNRNLAEKTLDYISDLHGPNASGSWEDDGENMILLSWDAYYELYPEEKVSE